MNYSERVDGIVGLLREKNIEDGYREIRLLLQDTVDWVKTLNLSVNREAGSDIINNINRILNEIISAMRINDSIYLVDLLKYELAGQIKQLPANREVQHGNI